MGRNYKRNKNITLAFPRDNETLQALIEDAASCGQSDKIGVFAAIRLAEYYKARRQGRILPEGASYSAPYPYPQAQAWGTLAAASSTPPSLNGNGHHPAAQSSGPSSAELERLKNRPEVVQAEGADDLGEDDLAFFMEDEEDED
jgi:hypothetical protein